MVVRLDKWLQVARVFKTRSQATRACNLGRVRVDGRVAKAHRALAVGNRIEIELRDRKRILIVRVLCKRPVRKAEATSLFDDLSPVPAAIDSPAVSAVRREPGLGRPTKRARRQLDHLRNR
jgi:ribosome-associated heat shock protein Hsp15